MHDDCFGLLRNVNKVTRWMLRLRIKNLPSLGSDLNRYACLCGSLTAGMPPSFICTACLFLCWFLTSFAICFHFKVLWQAACFTFDWMFDMPFSASLFQTGLILLRGVPWNCLTHMLLRIQHLHCAPSVQPLLGLCFSLRISLFPPSLSPVRSAFCSHRHHVYNRYWTQKM